MLISEPVWYCGLLKLSREVPTVRNGSRLFADAAHCSAQSLRVCGTVLSMPVMGVKPLLIFTHKSEEPSAPTATSFERLVCHNVRKALPAAHNPFSPQGLPYKSAIGTLQPLQQPRRPPPSKTRLSRRPCRLKVSAVFECPSLRLNAIQTENAG